MATIAIAQIIDAIYSCDQTSGGMGTTPPLFSSGVLLNKLLRGINRMGNTFDCLLYDASRDALHSLGN